MILSGRDSHPSLTDHRLTHTKFLTAPVLAVPVTALLARSPSEYDVEVFGPGNARRFVPVVPGIFDDNSGLVQVTGALSPGQRVVVASS